MQAREPPPQAQLAAEAPLRAVTVPRTRTVRAPIRRSTLTVTRPLATAVEPATVMRLPRRLIFLIRSRGSRPVLGAASDSRSGGETRLESPLPAASSSQIRRSQAPGPAPASERAE